MDARLHGRFTLEACLGTGGMGVVYRARDHERDALVALKVLQHLEPAHIAYFKNEFRALADVSHPNLAALFELFSEQGHWFFTMELVDGTDFISYVRNGPQRSTSIPLPNELATATLTTATTAETQGLARRSRPRPALPPLSEPAQFERLQQALPQLAEGVHALHTAGHLHRDIKPSNVMVAHDGRVVLLDFGAVAKLVTDGETKVASTIGTPAYMAPEQHAGGGLSEAVDSYAIGVMLYRTLTGVLPFQGDIEYLATAKRSTDPVPPEALAPRAPARLIQLCKKLLARDPARRPVGRELAERLTDRDSPSPRARLAPTEPPTLVGREAELAVLEKALDVVRSGEEQLVFVSGPAGVGKSSLIEHFLSKLDRDVVVLTGRCYVQESVPYKAVDSLIDALTQHLLQLSPDDVEALLPPMSQALATLFPVLRRVPAVAEMPTANVDATQPHELRRRGFTALRRLLDRIAARSLLVLYIDDMQWADADSVALLTEVLRPPAPPPILLVASYRTDPTADGELMRATRDVFVAEHDVVQVPLDRLSHRDAERLALLLLERAGVPESRRQSQAETIARESSGDPLFVGELVHYAAAGEGRELDQALTLQGVLCARFASLPETARRLLETLAVSGRAFPSDLLVRAAGAADAARKALKTLRTQRLVRVAAGRAGDEIEVYHDIVRRAAVGLLTPEALRERHAGLAHALRASGTRDPEPLAAHFEGAGDAETAARYYAAAGDRADQALAFHRAATLYQRAIDLGGSDLALQVRLADAFANSGRGEKSARAFLRAAEVAPGAQALDYRRRAAEELLHCGRVGEGEQLLESVCAAVGLRMVSSTARLRLPSLLALRARLRLRGLKFRERPAADIAPLELQRVDVCNAAAQGFAMVDTLRGSVLQTRGSLMALSTGEPMRIARALTTEVAFLGSAGPRAEGRTNRVLAAARAAAERAADRHIAASLVSSEGFAEYMFGHFPRARELLEQALPLLSSSSARGGQFWLKITRQFYIWSLYHGGAWARLCEIVPEYLGDAEARGDLYFATNLSIGYPAQYWLVRDDVDGARRQRELRMSEWSRNKWDNQHWWSYAGEVSAELYAGDGPAAWQCSLDVWPQLRKSLLLHIHTVQVEWRYLRGCAALAAMRAKPDDRASLLRSAERDARKLRGQHAEWARAFGHVVAAGVHSQRGNTDAAVASLRRASHSFDEARMKIHGAAVRQRLGRLLAGDEGRAMVEAATAAMREEAIVNPERVADQLAPGFE